MSPYRIFLSFGAIASFIAVTLSEANDRSKPVELGEISWLRDHQIAFELAKETGKPVLILFQEVPGCTGCQQYGKEILSDPDITKAIQKHFIPLAIYNNRGGNDRKILEKYSEPAWNYPVMRFFEPNGEEILPRKDRVWTQADTWSRIKKALEQLEKSKA